MLGRGTQDRKRDDARAQDEARGPVRGERRVAAWIGASIVIRGDLTSSEDITIAGRVHGSVAVRENTVVIASEGHVEGDVRARTVVVQGRVEGNISGLDSVEVGESGSVLGDISAPRMRIAEGGRLHGQVRIAGGTKAG